MKLPITTKKSTQNQSSADAWSHCQNSVGYRNSDCRLEISDSHRTAAAADCIEYEEDS